MDNRIRIFDTTLRDGEQSPGCSMNLKEKIEVAKCLERLHVDVIEAGFAISSPGDFESVHTIASTVKDASVASLARASEKDIDVAWDAVKHAANPRIHLFLATSSLHMEYKLKKTPDQILEMAESMTRHAAKYTSNVEFSAEDATRSDWDFLVKVTDAVIKAGATTVNIPDTVGYTTPSEMQALIEYIRERVPDSDKVIFSVHCHNDLGLATANSLSGVVGGARQIECTINGLGERSGNTALEEVIMAMHTRPGVWPYETNIDTTQIARASRTVYTIIGQSAPLNKPIVGKNAFAHESGIHQHGVLANKQTYEILTPESVGVQTNNIVLGKHSGKHAVADRLQTLGYQLSAEDLQSVFEEFKKLCDKKKKVKDADLEALVEHRSIKQEQIDSEGYELNWFSVHTSNFTTATCTVSLKRGEEIIEDVALGDGPIDAAYSAIDKIINPPEHTFGIWNIHSVSEGKDTLGEVTVRLYANGKTYSGKGLSTDVIEASINAYINAVNTFCTAVRKNSSREEKSA